MEPYQERGANSQLLDQFSKLLSQLNHSEDLNNLVNGISDLVGCPVALLDNKLRLISASQRGSATTEWELLLSNQGHRYIRALYCLHGQVEPYIQPLQRETGHILWEVFFPICADNVTSELEGVIYLICPDNSLLDQYKELLIFLCKALSWYLWRYTHMPRQQDIRLNLLLTEILKGNLVTAKERDDILKQCAFPTKRPLYLLVIETSAMEHKDYTLEHLKYAFSSIWTDSYALAFSADLLFLLPGPWGQSQEQRRQQEMFIQQLEGFGCYAGLSGEFHSLDETLMHHYIRALTAARTARKLHFEERYARYNEIALYSMVCDGPPPVSLRQLCDPLLMKLVAHDKHYGTQYVYTLCCYWQLNRNIPQICQYMHLHRNTLYYRLGKIKELLQQDIDDYENFMQLNLSLNILAVYGEIPNYRIRSQLLSGEYSQPEK